MSLTEYYRTAFIQAVDNMKELKHTQIPSDAMQALHFIVRLNPERYKEFTSMSLNAQRSGGAFLDTIQKASDAAKSSIPLVRISNQRAANPMVFSTKLNKPTKFTGTCNYCNKVGHKEKDCWNKKASSNDTDDSQAQKKAESTAVTHSDDKQSTSKKKKTEKSKQRSAHSTSVNNVGQNYAPDIYGFAADLQIEACMTKVCEFDSPGDRSKRIVSLDCCANHSFAFCTGITSDILHVNFTV
jgi:hypothetical protein